MLRVEGLYKSYGNIEILKGVDISVKKGEIVAILGSSGAGKSTLLHILGTLEPPSRGNIWLSDTPLHDYTGARLARLRNQKIGFIFQFHRLLPEFTALENVCLPAYIAGHKSKHVKKEALALLDRLGLTAQANQSPDTLSGGEAQRVAIARALINQPDIIYADEPSGNLDSANAAVLYHLFIELNKERKQTFLVVTHNEALANIAHRKLYMSDGTLS